MGRAALSRGGLAAVLVLLGLYVLLGGEIDLGGSDPSPTTTDAPTPTQTQPAPTDTGPQDEVPPSGGGEISQQEAEEIGRVLALVEAGGPFPHEQDGTTFSNREGLLPDKPEGHYKEYTCETPGSDNRGARRLVIGAGGETYYTQDHYESFIQIDPEDYR